MNFSKFFLKEITRLILKALKGAVHTGNTSLKRHCSNKIKRTKIYLHDNCRDYITRIKTIQPAPHRIHSFGELLLISRFQQSPPFLYKRNSRVHNIHRIIRERPFDSHLVACSPNGRPSDPYKKEEAQPHISFKHARELASLQLTRRTRYRPSKHLRKTSLDKTSQTARKENMGDRFLPSTKHAASASFPAPPLQSHRGL